jgi:predicted lipoprotein with Yx(FWY)xxD motif
VNKFLTLISYLFLNSQLVFSQWVSNTAENTPVSIELNDQQEQRIVSDKKGGAIVTWSDFRTDATNTIADVYIQRVKADGTMAWANNGVPVCINSSDQKTPFICADNLGGAIVCWQDLRNGNRDIYAQKFDSLGNALWAANGIPIVQKAASQTGIRIIEDGNNGFFLVWEDSINGNADIFAQKINADGTLQWASNGVVVCNSLGLQINPRLIRDITGGIIICWQDRRNGSNYDIYTQRISAIGTTIWTANGVLICNSVNTQSNPKIEPDNAGGAYIVWQDKRSALDFDVYCQRINASGSVAWATNGVLVCNAANSQSAIDATTEAISNGIIITWKDGRNGFNNIYTQFVNGNGTNVWDANGYLISTLGREQVNPNIIGAGNQSAIITWQDSTINGWDVYAQKINTSGNQLWNVGGTIVSDAQGNQTNPKNVSDGDGGSIFSFQDKRTGTLDIYVSLLKSNGTFNSLSSIERNNPFKIYPNPVANKLYFNNAQDFTSFNYSIYSIDGKLIETGFLNSDVTQSGININLKNGYYFLSISEIKTGKFYASKFSVIHE